MRDLLLFGAGPYLAVLLLVAGAAARVLAPAARRRLVDRCEESARLYRGSAVGRWALGLVVLAHFVAFVAPRAVLHWNRSPARLVLLEGAGFAVGLVALAGLVALWRGRRAGRAGPRPPLPPADVLALSLVALAMISGLATAALDRWGSEWYAVLLLPWVRSLFALRPDVSLVAPLPVPVRLHVLAGLALLPVLPWTRAFEALARPAVLLSRRLRSWGRTLPARLAGAAAELGLALAFGVLLTGALRQVGVSQGYAPAQPIAFSHRLHAGKYRMQCLYCHFAAETSRHAGIPPPGLCMGCHGQIKVASAEAQKLREAFAQRRPLRWIRVHNLPDFVYFNHSRHVRAGGLACERCHGPVATMERVRQAAPLTMGWCIDCHRGEGVVPAAQRAPGAPARRATGGLDCGKCHY